MSRSTKDFLSIVFDFDTDSSCFTTLKKGTAVSAVSAFEQTEYFCINALNSEVDNDPTEPYHHFELPRRAGVNITKHRTFLLEFDAGTAAEQSALIAASGVPYTACTFSGKKSRHYLITLKEPLLTKAEYDKTAARLYAVFAGKPGFDMANKNNSRLSRLPGTIRGDTGLLQQLIYLGTRIENSVFFAWLDLNVPVKAAWKPKYPTMTPETQLLLMGIKTKDPVAAAYNAVFNLQELGQSNEVIRAKILKAAPGAESIVDGALKRISLKDLRAEIATIEDLLKLLETNAFLHETFLSVESWAGSQGNYARLFKCMVWLADEFKVWPEVIEQLYVEFTGPALAEVGYSQQQIDHAMKTSIAKARQVAL